MTTYFVNCIPFIMLQSEFIHNFQGKGVDSFRDVTEGIIDFPSMTSIHFQKLSPTNAAKNGGLSNKTTKLIKKALERYISER